MVLFDGTTCTDLKVRERVRVAHTSYKTVSNIRGYQDVRTVNESARGSQGSSSFLFFNALMPTPPRLANPLSALARPLPQHRRCLGSPDFDPRTPHLPTSEEVQLRHDTGCISQELSSEVVLFTFGHNRNFHHLFLICEDGCQEASADRQLLGRVGRPRDPYVQPGQVRTCRCDNWRLSGR